jgi:hypothetical protein
MLAGGGGVGIAGTMRVIRYTDPVATLRLRDLSLTSGRKKLMALGLGERINPSNWPTYLL